MARIAVGVEYDGRAFHGWQTQRCARAVQSELERALASIANHPVAITGAGRTDAGVHAAGQVAHFDTDAERPQSAWLLGTNSELPPDVSVQWVSPVADHFHARYSALSRTYRYLILNRRARSALAEARALCVHRPLDCASMQAATKYLIGEHDFSAFRAAECQARSPVRNLQSLAVARDGDWITIEVTANAFLHHMVRNIVGLLLTIGRGEAAPERAREQLESRLRSTGEATAAACGLYLWQVDYPGAFGLPAASVMIGAPIRTAGN